MKLLQITLAIGLMVIAPAVRAAPIDAATAIATWSVVNGPGPWTSSNGYRHWTNRGRSEIFQVAGGATSSAFLAPASTTGDFSFSARMEHNFYPGTMGLVFGYQDGSNGYRLGWSGSDGYGFSNQLALVRESGGTSVALASISTTIASGTWYDFSVGRSGNTINARVAQINQSTGLATVIANWSVTDTQFMTGRYGLFDINREFFAWNLNDAVGSVPAVPAPGTVVLMAAAGLVMGARRAVRG